MVKVLAKLGPGDMAGEIGVVFNIPQPFTVRTRRLSQVIRIGHHQFKEMVQSDIDDAKIIITNFMNVKVIKIFIYRFACKTLLHQQVASFSYVVIISVFLSLFQYLKGLNDELNKEIPFLRDLLADADAQVYVHSYTLHRLKSS